MNGLLSINQFGCTRMGATFLFFRGPDAFEKYPKIMACGPT